MNFRSAIAGIVSLSALSAPALAFELPPLINLENVDKADLKPFLGKYDIRDKSGKKHCAIVLKSGETIGGMQAEVSPACATIFPVMGKITGWQLRENYTISLIDGLRKVRITFTTPSLVYSAWPEVDGIVTIVKGK